MTVRYHLAMLLWKAESTWRAIAARHAVQRGGNDLTIHRDRVRLEQGKLRLIEGDFAAARYHMAASGEKRLRVRAALVATRIMPQVLRRAYLALRRPAPMPMR